MNSATEAIPCKTKDRKRGGKPPAAARSATRDGNANNDAKEGECDLCKKYNTKSPNSWKMHPINYYKKYNMDGTTKPFEMQWR